MNLCMASVNRKGVSLWIPFHTFLLIFNCFHFKEVGLLCWQHREHLSTFITEFLLRGSSFLPPNETPFPYFFFTLFLLYRALPGETGHLKPAWGGKDTRHWLLHNIVHSLSQCKRQQRSGLLPRTQHRIQSRQRSGCIKTAEGNQCTVCILSFAVGVGVCACMKKYAQEHHLSEFMTVYAWVLPVPKLDTSTGGGAAASR